MARILAFALINFLLVSVPARTSAATLAEPPDWAVVSAIFAERCVMCHSQKGASRGLRLDSYETAIAGGKEGAVLVPGDSANSELIRRLRGESLPRMPFLSRPLPSEQIDLIIRWIEAGLPDTDSRSAPYQANETSHMQ